MLPEGSGDLWDQRLHDQIQGMRRNQVHLGVDLMLLLCSHCPNLPPVGSKHNEIKICINKVLVLRVN